MKVMDPGVHLQMPVKTGPSAESLKNKSREELREAAQEFESMFMNLVIKQMRQTVPESDVMGDSSKVQFFQGMLDEEYSKMAGERASNGLAELIYQNLARAQGLADED